MKKTPFRFTLYRNILYVVVLCSTIVSPVGAASSSMTFDFEQWAGAGSPWSTLETCIIQGQKILGLFNDRNKNYLPATRLTIKDIPANTPVTVSFDLFLVGTWDSDGQLGDRWTMTTEGGQTLLELTKFPNAYQDKEEKMPIGNKGILTVGNRDLAYWIVHENVTIPVDRIANGAVDIVFRGFLTGRKTEFWGLDNVNVKVGN